MKKSQNIMTMIADKVTDKKPTLGDFFNKLSTAEVWSQRSCEV